MFTYFTGPVAAAYNRKEGVLPKHEKELKEILSDSRLESGFNFTLGALSPQEFAELLYDYLPVNSPPLPPAVYVDIRRLIDTIRAEWGWPFGVTRLEVVKEGTEP